MKKSRKILVVLIVFEVILLFVPLVIDVLSFKNGPLSQHFNPNYATEAEIQNWYVDHYGTHDWIAEAALDAIMADSTARLKWIGENENYFWTAKRKVIFLIGTEAPDSTDGSNPKKVTKLSLNGIHCTGRELHPNVAFYEDEGENRMRIKSFPTFFSQVMSLENKARKYLREGKCDAAAFYMGAILHMVADMACWPHVLRQGDWIHDWINPFYTYTNYTVGPLGDISDTFERAVHEVTNDKQDREKVFNYPQNFPIMSVKSVTALKLVSFDTRWDFGISEVDYYKKPLPFYIMPSAGSADVLYDYYTDYSTYEQARVSSWEWDFKDRVQENLDMAVKYSAYVLNDIADDWAKGDNPKFCDECGGREKDQRPEIKRFRQMGTMLSILMLIGIALGFSGPLLNVLAQAVAAA